MVILLSGQGVYTAVSNELRKGSAGGVKSKTDWDVRHDLEISINCLGGTDDLDLASFGLEILSQQSSIGIGIIT